ncbi:MAG: NAD(P)H-dependent oxidoreductase [Alphaproteobacteria bacterium]
MKIFIVCAHPEPKSFNHAMANLAVEVLGERGHEVRVSDLYAMGFNPVGGRWEFKTLPDPDYFEYMSAQGFAARRGEITADVAAEHEKLLWCDLLILQFPMWWFGMPAILKGWVDRVMSNGTAYSGEMSYETGGFRGRRASVSMTTSVASGYYEVSGRGGYMAHLLWPINNGTLRYCGFDVLPFFVADGIGDVDEETHRRYLEDYRAHLIGLETAEPFFFHTAEDYDDELRLKPGVAAQTEMQNPELLLKKASGA